MIRDTRLHATLPRPRRVWTLLGLLAIGQLALCARADDATTFRDKTLVAWVRLDNLDQPGVAAISLENLPGQFDAIVYGELHPRRWMAGSDQFQRTRKEHAADPAETADPKKLICLALVHRDNSVELYRDGTLYSRHQLDASPPSYSAKSLVLLGLRHWEITGPTFKGSIAEARLYNQALPLETIASLRPDSNDGPEPLGWWTFEDGTARDQAGTFPPGRIIGSGRIRNGLLTLNGGYLLINADPPRSRLSEDWPVYHITALPEEGLCRPYDANGCIFWKGKYHLMYIYQDRTRPREGHSWGHASSTDLVNWTFHPPAIVPEPNDPDVGIFSGNAFINRDGVPMLCWFGIDAGVCVATAQDDDLIRWAKHPSNPIVPMPKPGDPNHGRYRVWDPYLWLEGDKYICLLGGNAMPDGKDTLYTLSSPDLVTWTPLHPFYEQPDPSWTTEGEDCSCPDFFPLGDRHVLLCISHKIGARAYIGRFDPQSVRFHPEKHIRMNWPGGHFFAPESLLDNQGRRIIWAWVTDPRTIITQQSTGSGVQSLPRLISLRTDGTLNIEPTPELASLRTQPHHLETRPLPPDQLIPIPQVAGDTIELDLKVDTATSQAFELLIRRSPGGEEETIIRYEPAREILAIDMSRSSLRTDVVYTQGPLDTGGITRASDYPNPRLSVEAPLKLEPGEPLHLRVFLDRPMLEVFANNRQCLTQQVFPSRKDSLHVAVRSKGGTSTLTSLESWVMAPARFINHKSP